jgi:D-sedoheptulose 7-phosphate isomerase
MQMDDSGPVGTGKVSDDSGQLRELASAHILASAEVTKLTARTSLDSVVRAAQIIASSFRGGNKVLLCGNGGSAADAQHMAAEFVNRLSRECERPGLPAIALTTDTSFITSYANDYGYDGVFERQLTALGRPDDVLIGISTSGNSRNIIKAIESARELSVRTIGLVGEGGELAALCDHAVVIPSRDTQHIQEALLTIEHVICLLVERELFPAAASRL